MNRLIRHNFVYWYKWCVRPLFWWRKVLTFPKSFVWICARIFITTDGTILDEAQFDKRTCVCVCARIHVMRAYCLRTIKSQGEDRLFSDQIFVSMNCTNNHVQVGSCFEFFVYWPTDKELFKLVFFSDFIPVGFESLLWLFSSTHSLGILLLLLRFLSHLILFKIRDNDFFRMTFDPSILLYRLSLTINTKWITNTKTIIIAQDLSFYLLFALIDGQ